MPVVQSGLLLVIAQWRCAGLGRPRWRHVEVPRAGHAAGHQQPSVAGWRSRQRVGFIPRRSPVRFRSPQPDAPPRGGAQQHIAGVCPGWRDGRLKAVAPTTVSRRRHHTPRRVRDETADTFTNMRPPQGDDGDLYESKQDDRGKPGHEKHPRRESRAADWRLPARRIQQRTIRAHSR